MNVVVAKGAGFCKGVETAVNMALKLAEKYGRIYTLGELVHNELVTKYLAEKGAVCIDIEDAGKLGAGDVALIRAHGITRELEAELKARGVKLYDATCKVVKRNQSLAQQRAEAGDEVVIFGDEKHDEVVALKSYAGQRARVISDLGQLEMGQNNLSILFQTTILTQKFEEVRQFVEDFKNFHNKYNILVEIFNTICYTTKAKQVEARSLAEHSDALLVLGSRSSANTRRLAEVAEQVNPNVFRIENVQDAVRVANKIKDFQSVSIVAGASTPPWLIREVSKLMSETQNAETEVTKEATLQEQTPVEAEVKPESSMTMDDYMKSDRAAGYIEYRVGKRVRGKVINANEDGVNVWIGGKNDAFIDKSEATLDGNYDPADFKKDDEIQAVIIEVSKGQVKLSKKQVDEKKQEEAEIAKMLSGEFSLKMDGILTTKEGKKVGLTGKLGKHTVFVPASEIRIGYVNNLEEYVGKTLRLELLPPKAKNKPAENAENTESVEKTEAAEEQTAAEVETVDESAEQSQQEQQVRRNLPLFIRASQRRILEREKQAKEDEFWNSLHVNDIVTGKVKRFAAFGAFVSVKGFDCLAHNTELSWNRITDPSTVLKIGESYDFVVLKCDRATGKISLGYRQLQKKPYEIAREKYPVGTVIKGKVERIFSYGAFVSIEDGIDGLVHVSQISHNWIKDANEALKVGQEVEAQIIGFEDNRITLSMKALTPAPEETTHTDDSEATDEEKAVKRSSRLKKFEQKVNEGESRKDRRPRKESANEPKEWVSGSSSATLGDLFKGLNLNLAEEEGNKEE